MTGWKVVAPLTYRAKAGCQSALCTAMPDGMGGWKCFGWHCSYCDEPCSYQGHGCDVSKTLIEAAQREVKP